MGRFRGPTANAHVAMSFVAFYRSSRGVRLRPMANCAMSARAVQEHFLRWYVYLIDRLCREE
jgi:hypothetical protein